MSADTDGAFNGGDDDGLVEGENAVLPDPLDKRLAVLWSHGPDVIDQRPVGLPRLGRVGCAAWVTVLRIRVRISLSARSYVPRSATYGESLRAGRTAWRGRALVVSGRAGSPRWRAPAPDRVGSNPSDVILQALRQNDRDRRVEPWQNGGDHAGDEQGGSDVLSFRPVARVRGSRRSPLGSPTRRGGTEGARDRWRERCHGGGTARSRPHDRRDGD